MRGAVGLLTSVMLAACTGVAGDGVPESRSKAEVGENDDACTAPQQWRCVYSALHQTTISQVCRSCSAIPPTDAKNWQVCQTGDAPARWVSYALTPASCNDCQGAYSAGCEGDPPPSFVPVDLLVVVDNSGSMAEEQQRLADNFPRMIEALKLGGTALLPDLRIGVISTDLGAGPYTSLPSCEVAGGDGGLLQGAPDTCVGPANPWLHYFDGQSNVPEGSPDEMARVRDAFSCIAKLGTAGCGFEQPLEAMRLALDGANGDFIRPHSVLAVLFLTDEDDCSASDPATLFDPRSTSVSDPVGPLTSFRCFEYGVECDVNGRTPGARQDCVPAAASPYVSPVSKYLDFLRVRRPNGRLVVGAIAGQTDSIAVVMDGKNPSVDDVSESCPATPAVRLKAVIDAFGASGVFGSICDADYGPMLQRFAAAIRQAREL